MVEYKRLGCKSEREGDLVVAAERLPMLDEELAWRLESAKANVRDLIRYVYDDATFRRKYDRMIEDVCWLRDEIADLIGDKEAAAELILNEFSDLK